MGYGGGSLPRGPRVLPAAHDTFTTTANLALWGRFSPKVRENVGSIPTVRTGFTESIRGVSVFGVLYTESRSNPSRSRLDGGYSSDRGLDDTTVSRNDEKTSDRQPSTVGGLSMYRSTLRPMPPPVGL